ncbi:hypothetical protein NQ315_010645 [Exocentrus adspersus]|uniref:Uncharacterized protein n=1 Tax=Exocentrus adspersus TaxID=1586481 RepID=A0AAV8W5X3_9CUCU|nr:hypothetical protein NQ315_010645 [Exocentrus adspersus]
MKKAEVEFLATFTSGFSRNECSRLECYSTDLDQPTLKTSKCSTSLWGTFQKLGEGSIIKILHKLPRPGRSRAENFLDRHNNQANIPYTMSNSVISGPVGRLSSKDQSKLCFISLLPVIFILSIIV